MALSIGGVWAVGRPRLWKVRLWKSYIPSDPWVVKFSWLMYGWNGVGTRSYLGHSGRVSAHCLSVVGWWLCVPLCQIDISLDLSSQKWGDVNQMVCIGLCEWASCRLRWRARRCHVCGLVCPEKLSSLHILPLLWTGWIVGGCSCVSRLSASALGTMMNVSSTYLFHTRGLQEGGQVSSASCSKLSMYKLATTAETGLPMGAPSVCS